VFRGVHSMRLARFAHVLLVFREQNTP